MRDILQTGIAQVETPLLNSDTGRLGFHNNSILSSQTVVGVLSGINVSVGFQTANALVLADSDSDAFLTLFDASGRAVYKSVPVAGLFGSNSLYSWYVNPFFLDLEKSYVSYRNIANAQESQSRFTFALKLGTYEG